MSGKKVDCPICGEPQTPRAKFLHFSHYHKDEVDDWEEKWSKEWPDPYDPAERDADDTGQERNLVKRQKTKRTLKKIKNPDAQRDSLEENDEFSTPSLMGESYDEFRENTFPDAEASSPKITADAVLNTDQSSSTKNPGRILEEFFDQFGDIEASFVNILIRTAEMRDELPTPLTLVSDLVEGNSGVANQRYAQLIGELYEGHLKKHGILPQDSSPGTGTAANATGAPRRESISLNRGTGGDGGTGLSFVDAPDPETEALMQARDAAKHAGVNIEGNLDATIDKVINTRMKMQLLQSLESGFGNSDSLSKEEVQQMLMQQQQHSQSSEVQQIRQEMQQEREAMQQMMLTVANKLEEVDRTTRNPAATQQQKSRAEEFGERLIEDFGEELLKKATQQTERGGGGLDPDTVRSLIQEAKQGTTQTGTAPSKYDVEMMRIDRETQAKKEMAKMKTQSWSEMASAIREAIPALGEAAGRGFGSANTHTQQSSHGYAQTPVPQPNNGSTQTEMNRDMSQANEPPALLSTECVSCGKTFEFPAEEPAPVCPYCGQEHANTEQDDSSMNGGAVFNDDDEELVL